jgi:polar amino acid transport system substrate-binding protein
MSLTLPRLLTLTCALLLGACAPACAQALRIASWERHTDPLVIANEAILTRAYAELKQPIVFIGVPIRRAMSMMLKGEIDGNLHRVGELAGQYPTLIRVATPLMTTPIHAYSKAAHRVVANWRELDGLTVAYARGTLVIERNLPPTARRVETRSTEDALRMAAEGIVDVAIVAIPQQAPLSAYETSGKLHRLEPALDQVALYHYLIARHRGLAERLDVVLARLQASGELDQIRQRALGQAGPGATVRD